MEDEPEVAAASAEEKEENVRLDETIISESPVDHQEPESVEQLDQSPESQHQADTQPELVN